MMLTLFSFFFVFSRFFLAITGSDVSAMFVFGDSLVDAGNNDFLDTISKCNYFPYGVDFFMGATGRCTNGRTSADILGQLLSLPHFLPVFYDPQTRGSSILAGVNYASGGSGILDSTHRSYNVTPLSQQIANFQTTLADLKSQLNGSLALSSYLSRSIFFFCIGGGDYFVTCCSASGVAVDCDLQTLTELLILNYTTNLMRAYDLGARKFVVLNLLQTGCDPYYKLQNNGSCVDALNEGSTLFNNALRPALESLSADLPGFTFVYVNTSGIINDIISDPTTYGLKVTNESCCFLSEAYGTGPLCVEGTEPCLDRSIYAFYDGLHLTEQLYMHLSTKAYSSELQTEAYPFNVEVLANLNTSLMLGGESSFPIHDN